MVARGYAMDRINNVVAGTFRIHERSKTSNFHGEIVNRSQAFLDTTGPSPAAGICPEITRAIGS